MQGAVGEKSLPQQLSITRVEVAGKKEEICILVTNEDSTPLLGHTILHRKLAE